MAKKSQKRHVQYEKDHSGCIWGLVSIFDFRHGRTTRKLISDRRHGSRHSGSEYTRNRFELLSNLDEKSQENIKLQEGKEAQVAVASDAKPSVKELMEVEMVGEGEVNKEINNANIESKGSKSVHEEQKKKHRKRRTKSWSKSSNVEIEDLGVSESSKSEMSRFQISGKQCIKDLNVESMVEEFCRQIHQKNISCEEHDRNSEEVQLDEAIRNFINQKVVDNKQLTGNENMKELMDIFQILSLDEELFLKLIQDSNSPLLKYVRNWRDNQIAKNGKSVSLPASSLSEQKSGYIMKSEELINNKQRNFFRRKIKSEERSLLTEKENVNASKRIVILKPSPTGLQSSEIENSLGSSSESHNVIRNKSANKKANSYFSFTKFKGKLRNAMGKERHEMYTGSTENSCQSDCQKIGDGEKTNSCDNIGKSSPGKDHFFIERFAKPSTCLKRDERSSQAKDSAVTNDRETAGSSARRVSNMYIEAKRHLSEMLSTGEQNAESSSQRFPRSLGRILSLPEYNFSPISSPKMELVYDMTTIGRSGHDKDQMTIKRDTEYLKEVEEECQPGQAIKLEDEIHISENDRDSEVQKRDSAPSTNNELTCDATVQSTCPATDETDTEGDLEVRKETKDACLEDTCSLGASSQPSSSSTRDDQNFDLTEVQESYDDTQLPAPGSSPPSSPLSNKKAEEKEAATYTQERPSPVSVLDPLFVEDDISPGRTISQRKQSELPVEPLHIHFEEWTPSSPKDQDTRPNIYEDKESVYEYVSAALQASNLKWDELFLGSARLLEPSLLEKIEFNWPHHDQKLLFDVVNEVLMDFYECYFAFSLWVAFVKPGIRPPPKNVTNEIWKGVSWHLIQLPQPRTLDQIVRKDMARSESWLDLRCDAENIGFGMGEAILEELVEETILSCLNECSGEDIPLPVALNEIESSECKC